SLPQYNLNPPGARSLGMGATFIAIADDATAAEANPAGLTILSKPEISFHMRRSVSSNTETNFFSTISSQKSFDDSSTYPSFASFVYPLQYGAVSAYYHRAVDFRSHSEFESGFGNETFESLELQQEDVGLAAAFRLGSL